MPVAALTSVTTSEVVYPIVVNGYLCYSAAEVAAVRRGQSPDSVRPGAARQSEEEEALAPVQARAQAQALIEAQTRIAQFSQLPIDEQYLMRQDSRRGILVDLYA